jgi:hypothetical protein
MIDLKFTGAVFTFDEWEIHFIDYRPGEDSWKNYYTHIIKRNGEQLEERCGLYLPDGLTLYNARMVVQLFIENNKL